jgi:putative ATPase
VEEALQQKALNYDKSGEEHFNLISALHKSMRGSDPDAALYWLGRMLQAGEDPLYIVRRLVRFASEDIGLADPQALAITINAQAAVHFIGMPEGELAVAQAVLYLATAPKSNRIYKAYGQVKRAVAETGSLPVPLPIRNAPTALTKAVGYGRGYKYPPDHQEHFVNQQYLPDALCDRRFYEPTSNGFETQIKARMQKWEMMRQRLRQNRKGSEPKD